jgi:hypothetical protein
MTGAGGWSSGPGRTVTGRVYVRVVPSIAAPPVVLPPQTLPLGDRVADLSTRALIVAVAPEPRFAREAEIVAWVRAALDGGADIVEVPSDPRLLGPAARERGGVVTARATTAAERDAVLAAGAAFALVPADVLDDVIAGDPDPADSPGREVVLVGDARSARDARDDDPARPVALDVTRLTGVDAVSEESLGLAVGVRLVRTTDLRRTRRVVEVMAHLLQARRSDDR